jgi:hypothetical protein
MRHRKQRFTRVSFFPYREVETKWRCGALWPPARFRAALGLESVSCCPVRPNANKSYNVIQIAISQGVCRLSRQTCRSSTPRHFRTYIQTLERFDWLKCQPVQSSPQFLLQGRNISERIRQYEANHTKQSMQTQDFSDTREFRIL